MARYVGRENVRKRLEPLAGRAGRTTYADGAARVETADETITVRPPFGLAHARAYERVELGPLFEALDEDHLVAALLVRLGGYAVGVLDGERLVASKVGTRFVKGKHKKGGSSSNRFRRRRVEQARDAYDRACAVAEEILAPQAGRFDEFVLAGDRLGLEQVIERSRVLTELSAHALTLPVHVPEVRRALLEQLGRELWSSTVELSRQAGPDSQVSSAAGA